MKPYIICHMVSSLDGGLHPSRWTDSPDGELGDWTALYQSCHQKLEGDAWMVGRVTMAEMSRGGPHPPGDQGKVERPFHFANREAANFAVALDMSGKLHFTESEIDGDHIVVLLGSDVPDSHLAELADDGISYIVSAQAQPDLSAMLDTLGRELGIKRLLLEGGAGINGSFLAAGLVNEISLIVAPALDGRSASQSIVEYGEEGLAGKIRLSLKSCETLGHGAIYLRYAVTP
ncbi:MULTISPECIES: RibD family protein [unclassified Rhizobium]|uniref:RibD family protein n=1 Tax=unclassified Rhizobium TaxID=2613769 RepID=UPI000EA88250|nr:MULTISPECIES: RibD family protein [unclassified Rhizobium]AYG68457.1 RibD family protein [Rhizobium sp. CCGE531]AYG74840.1 RibD family protein [Rhizobium sp. CCGE532]